jgi:hypothetical protein
LPLLGEEGKGLAHAIEATAPPGLQPVLTTTRRAETIGTELLPLCGARSTIGLQGSVAPPAVIVETGCSPAGTASACAEYAWACFAIREAS